MYVTPETFVTLYVPAVPAQSEAGGEIELGWEGTGLIVICVVTPLVFEHGDVFVLLTQ